MALRKIDLLREPARKPRHFAVGIFWMDVDRTWCQLASMVVPALFPFESVVMKLCGFSFRKCGANLVSHKLYDALHHKKMSNVHKFSIWKYIWFAMFLVSCEGKHYSAYDFSFPPDSHPYENGWKYRARVKMDMRSYEPAHNEKEIRIFVADTNGNLVLLDEFTLASGQIEAKAVWKEEDKLIIELFEVGNPAAGDAYNEALLKRGPKLMRKVSYSPVRALNNK
jgi:hypothetical protein